jgi:hypothetical protein
MKRCTKCGQEKPPTELRRDRSRKDGRYPQCRACEKEWRTAKAERLKAYHRAWSRTNPEKKRAHDRRYRQKKLEGTRSSIGSRSESRTAAIGRESERDSPTRFGLERVEARH